MLRILFLALLVGGCSLSQPIARSAIDYNEAVERAANTLLLRNILRARDEMPLHFTTIPQIRGSLNLGVGQPGLSIPLAAGLGGALGLGLSGGVSPSFDVSALDTQEFTRGLLEPLEPTIFRYYLERGYPEELLLMLFFSSIEQPGTGRRIPNDPRCWLQRPDCPAPAGGAAVSMTLRDTVGLGRFIFHDYLSLEPVGGSLSAAQSNDPALLALLADQRLRLRPVAAGRFQLYRSVPQVAVCRRINVDGRSFIVPSAASSLLTVPRQDAATCTRTEVVAPDMAAAPTGERVLVRSVQEILRFLGILVRVQQTIPQPAAGPRRCLTFAVVRSAEPLDERRACLFQILPEADVQQPALRLTHDGVAYAVPRFREATTAEAGDYSVLLLALVNDLINLKKASSAIPTTRAVQLVR